MRLKRLPSVQSFTGIFQKIFHPAEHNESLIVLSVWVSETVDVDSADFDDALGDWSYVKRLPSHATCLLRNTSPAAYLGNQHNCSGAVRSAPWVFLLPCEEDSIEFRQSPVSNHGTIGLRDVSGTHAIPRREAKLYQLVQRFEGKHGRSVKGSCIVAVSILPAEGQEADIDAWYRQEHLAVLATTLPYIRSTRYAQSLDSIGPAGQRSRLLALHEYTSSKALLEHALEHREGVEVTPWSKRIFANAVAVERTIWDVTHH